MKPTELRSMSDEQLDVTLKDTVKTLFQLRIKAETDRLESKNELKKARRDIARIKTIVRLRELKRPDGYSHDKQRGS